MDRISRTVSCSTVTGSEIVMSWGGRQYAVTRNGVGRWNVFLIVRCRSAQRVGNWACLIVINWCRRIARYAVNGRGRNGNRFPITSRLRLKCLFPKLLFCLFFPFVLELTITKYCLTNKSKNI